MKGKEIIVGITGAIAAYKAAEFVRLLIKEGANIHVVMTKNAHQFITPLTFQTLSGNPVITELFTLIEEKNISHISLADLAHLIVIIPATANIIGKIANGIADDFLTTMVMATKAPVLFVPSMNENMWENEILQKNIKILIERGYQFIEPEEGELACHWYGKGRLPELNEVVEKIEEIFSPKDLKGEKILITAGPTQEPIDPVRFITNRSSGKMGYVLAKIAKRRGGDVVLISGPTFLQNPRKDIKIIKIRTAQDMEKEVLRHFEESTVVIKAAAVSDFKPRSISENKIKKDGSPINLELEETPDILKEIGRLKGNRIIVGFAAETEDLIKNAQKKLVEKNLDFIVVNDVTKPEAGFEADTNLVKIIYPDGEIKDFPLLSKDEVSKIILDEIVCLLKKRNL